MGLFVLTNPYREPEAARRAWKAWLAWHPVAVRGRLVWGVTVERRLVPIWDSDGEVYFDYEYRFPKSNLTFAQLRERVKTHS